MSGRLNRRKLQLHVRSSPLQEAERGDRLWGLLDYAHRYPDLIVDVGDRVPEP